MLHGNSMYVSEARERPQTERPHVRNIAHNSLGQPSHEPMTDTYTQINEDEVYDPLSHHDYFEIPDDDTRDYANDSQRNAVDRGLIVDGHMSQGQASRPVCTQRTQNLPSRHDFCEQSDENEDVFDSSCENHYHEIRDEDIELVHAPGQATQYENPASEDEDEEALTFYAAASADVVLPTTRDIGACGSLYNMNRNTEAINCAIDSHLAMNTVDGGEIVYNMTDDCTDIPNRTDISVYGAS
ncbi:regulation of response to stimulus [Branchiostoma belcheri]|nr:regulation of response to stimulus [Branchiostoma belcheri]